MAYVITGEDLFLIHQPEVKFYINIEVLNDDGTVIDSLDGVIPGGSQSIDANSDIRRTINFTIIPTRKQDIKINEASYVWFNKTINVKVGIENIRTSEIKWWNQGHYVYTNTSGTYDANTNQLQINCADFMALLDGSRNGTLGQLQLTIPAYKENSDTGEVIEYSYIRKAMIKVINQLGRISQIEISDIGEYKGLEDRNPDGYMEYRKSNPTWDCVPYDLEFSSGDNVLSLITALRDLYPNYETFFSVDNVFVCRMKPSGYNDMVYLTNEQLQSILVSENTESVNNTLSEVKNISEVWGNVIEVDYYTEEGVSYSDNVYSVPNSAYVNSTASAEDQRYYNRDKIAFRVPSTNLDGPSMNIAGLGAIPIYDGENLNPLSANVLLADRTHTFEIRREYKNGVYDTRAVYLGQYQPHAMTVLLSQANHDEMYVTNTGVTVEKYSPEYFYEVYNVSPHALTRTINPDSPFTIEKIGEILQVETKDSCTSDDLALARSNYNNFISSRLTDNVTITTLLAPFLDVNIKVEYKPYNSDTVNQYLIDTISHDYENGTTSITMHRFYPLYKDWI